MPMKDKLLCERRDWEKHLRIERWLMNKSLKKEWRELLWEVAEEEKADFEAVCKALGCPPDFIAELPYGGIADDDEAPESLL